MSRREPQYVGLLRAARARIVQGWTRSTMARDKYNRDVSPVSPKAVRWCAIGALAAERPRARMYNAAIRRLRQHLPPEVDGAISQFNDRGVKAQVLSLYDQAIESAIRGGRRGVSG